MEYVISSDDAALLMRNWMADGLTVAEVIERVNTGVIDMAELITVRGNHDAGGVSLHEINADHPAGEAFIIGNMVAQVAKTPEVEQRIWSGLLIETDEPVTVPFDGYDKLSMAAVASRVEKMSDNERILVRQYEAANKNRKTIVAVEPTPPEPVDPTKVDATTVLAAPKKA